MELRGSNPGLL